MFDTATAPKNVTSEPSTSSIPEEALDSRNPYGFIGRDGPVLELERALHRPPAGILIHGLGGIGKTTLCRGFIKWLADTNGLPHGCIWFSFQEIRSAESVINHLVETLFGTNAMAASTERKLQILVQTLRANRLLIVWDNFEAVRGDSNESMAGTLSEADQHLLAGLLQQLRGGKTNVLITSRSNEPWLDAASCFRLPIRGLSGEERWEFCNVIVKDFGLTIDRTQKDWQELIDMLDGHPLAMRVILSRLRDSSPAQLMKGLTENLEQFVGLDAESAKLFATLRFVSDGLPDDLQCWLIPVSLHERFLDADYVKEMGKNLVEPHANANSEVDRLMLVLSSAGLISGVGQGMYELHPALSRFLQQSNSVNQLSEQFTAWRRCFVNFMGSLANHYTAKELQEKLEVFHFHGANFQHALELATHLQMTHEQSALTQSLAAYALNSSRYQEAKYLLASFAELRRRISDFDGEAGAYNQLGIIALEQRDFATADQWFRKSLAIKEKMGNEDGMSRTYHNLGVIAAQQHDFAMAEQWYRKSLTFSEKHGNRQGVSDSYHQLGMIALVQRDFMTAEQWYRKSLAISEQLGNEYRAAATYHQLGIAAREQRDFTMAEQWYRKSLAISERLGNEHQAADSYHELGIAAQEQRDFTTAEQWYRKSLAISEQLGNEHRAATTYHQLGTLAEDQSDFATAEQWCRKSLVIFEKQGNEHGAANSYHQLGTTALGQRNFATADQWYRKSLAINEKLGNEHGAAMTYHQLGNSALEQRNFATAEQWYRKSLAINEKLGNEHSAAITYSQLATLAEEQRDFMTAEQWYRKSLAINEKLGNEHSAAMTYHKLGNGALEQRDFTTAEQWYRKSLAMSEKVGNEHWAATNYAQLGILNAHAEQHFEAGQWILKAISVFTKSDPNYAEQARKHFLFNFDASTEFDQQRLRELWQSADLGAFPAGEST